MRIVPLLVLLVCSITPALQAADATTKISGVHLCCQSCVRGVERAVGQVKGVTAVVDEDAGTVELKAADKIALQKGAEALVGAGYFGKSSDAGIKLTSDPAPVNRKVQTLKLEGVHLCCGQCVSAVGEAVKSVSGVKDHTAKKNAKTFEVTGDFNEREVMEALQKAGLTGKIAK